jgi:hypothetical protein
VVKTLYRTPRNYDGTVPTTHRVSEILPNILQKIGDLYHERPDLVLAAWPSIIGPKLAPMTEAVSFCNGELVVKVKNSTLYSLLRQHDKKKVLDKFRKMFPKIEINNIFFRIG